MLSCGPRRVSRDYQGRGLRSERMASLAVWPCVELDDGIVAALRARIVAGSRRPAGGLRMGSVFDFGDRSSGMYVYADIRN